MNLLVEMFFVKIEDQNVRYSKITEEITSSLKDPDKTVQSLIENRFYETPKMVHEDYIIHSTSWRYEEGGSVILTYVVYSDHIDFDDMETKLVPIADLAISSNPDIRKPRPDVITEENVISHGIRHLCFLINRDNAKYSRALFTSTIEACKLIEVKLGGRIR